MSTVCPVLVNFGAYADDEGLWVVRLSDRTVRLRLADAQGQALWQWLGRWCDGQSAMADVLAAYAESSIASVSADAFKALLDDLLAAGVLQDAAQVLPNLVYLAHPNALWGRVLPEPNWPTCPELTQHDTGVRWVGHFDSSVHASPWQGLVQGRQSTYRFKDQGLTLSELGQLLQCYASVGHGPSGVRRAVPSGGGLYQLKLWLLLLKPCEGFAVGVYEVVYRADGAVGLVDVNGLVGVDLWQQALLASTDPAALQHASAWLVVGADLAAIAKKYRNSAYNHALVEAGAVLQNLGLIASALDAGMHLRANFDHARLHEVCHAGEVTLLISAVMGVKAANMSNAAAGRDESLRIKMGWATGGSELPFHVATACVLIGEHMRMDCVGRSRDAALAYDKALSEGLERYAMMHGPQPVVARWGDLPNMVHPHAMLRWMDVNFDETQCQAWIAFENLATGQTHYVLQDLCFVQPSHEAPYAQVNTSGMACAPSRDMALTLATLELVERDAFMRAWLTGASCQPLPLQMMDEDTRALSWRFEAEGCRVVLGLLPSMWAVVVMVFVQHEKLGFTRISTAADFDVVSAAGKAMSEAASGVMGSLRGFQPEPIHVADVLRPEDHGRLYCQREHFRQADFLVASREPTQEALPTSTSHDLLQRMWQAGLSVYACEVTLPEEREYLKGGHPVVCRVVIPGLIAMTFGSAPFPLPEFVVPAWREGESPTNRTLVHPFP
jgi:thiazole/oxazole-forming peptide maturase SagD family component